MEIYLSCIVSRVIIQTKVHSSQSACQSFMILAILVLLVY